MIRTLTTPAILLAGILIASLGACTERPDESSADAPAAAQDQQPAKSTESGPAPATSGDPAPAANTTPASARSDEAEPIQKPEVSLEGVEVRGSGPIPMVLIHEIGIDWSMWADFMERNAERYTMYAINLPGMGGTPAPEAPDILDWPKIVLFNNAVNGIAELIVEREIHRPVVVGQGLGGHLAALFALRYPELTRGFVSMAGDFRPPYNADRYQLTDDEITAEVRKSMQPVMRMTDERYAEINRARIYQYVSDPEIAEEHADMFIATSRGLIMQYSLETFFSDLGPELLASRVPMLVCAPLVPEEDPRAVALRWREYQIPKGRANTTLVFFEFCRSFMVFDDPFGMDTVLDQWLTNQEIEYQHNLYEPIEPFEHPELE